MMIIIIILQSCFSLLILILFLKSAMKNRRLSVERNKIMENTAACESQMQKIEEKNRGRTEFYLRLAYELRTPLTLVQNNLADYINTVHPRITPVLKSLQHHVNKLITDMANLLDYERIGKGEFLYQHTEILNVTKTLSLQVELFMAAANRKQIKISFSPKESFYVKMSPESFERAICNILDNAIKYAREKGKIEITLGENASDIVLSIKDNGPGIPDPIKANLFLPYAGINGKKTDKTGIGIGLSIVKHIIDSMNGRLEILSLPEKGTVVSLSLPRYQMKNAESVSDFKPGIQAQDIPPASLPEECYDPAKQTLFIVGENAEFISLMYRIMNNHFNIYYASDGQKAVEKLKVIPKPDIILAGISMKKSEGYEFLEMCVQTEKLMDIPVVFISGQTGLEEKIEGFRKGVFDFVCKPFSMEVLLEKIKSILKNREITRNIEIKKIENRIAQLIRTEGDNEFLNFEKKCSQFRITPREKAVLRELFKGLETKEIGIKLFTSINTVRKHVRSIYEKCKVQNRVELLNKFR